MRNLFLALSVALLGCTAFANNTDASFVSSFNKLQGVPAASKFQLGTVMQEAHLTQVCVYDFTKMGAATSAAVVLRNTDLITPCTLPAKAIILNGFIDVTTAVTATGGAATVKIQTHGASSDLLASTTAGSGRKALIPVWGTLSNAVKLGTTSSYSVDLQGTSGTLTAGHLRVFLNYVQGE